MTFQPFVDILMLSLIPAGLIGFLWAIRRAVRRERGEERW